MIDDEWALVSPQSGSRAGSDGHKRKRGSEVQLAIDILEHLLALLITPANEQERAQVAQRAEPTQQVTGDSVESHLDRR